MRAVARVTALFLYARGVKGFFRFRKSFQRRIELVDWLENRLDHAALLQKMERRSISMNSICLTKLRLPRKSGKQDKTLVRSNRSPLTPGLL